MVATACQDPRELGMQRTLWSHAAVSQAGVEAGRGESISARTVGRILQQVQLKPHRVRMWCHSDDPRFQEKLRDIVEAYLHPPRGEPVLYVDEKSKRCIGRVD